MSSELALKPIPGELTVTGLVLAPSLSYEEWEGVGRVLGDIGRGVMFWIGDWITYGEANYGEKYSQALEVTGYEYGTLANAAFVARSIESSRRRENLSFAHHQEVAPLAADEQDELLNEAESEKLTRNDLRAKVRKRRERQLKPAPPSGSYQTIVIDPPWEMEKIERDVRPKQHGFDYPTMTEDELSAFPLPDIAAPDCHLYLWTTHKHLPLALRLAEAWGFNYECLMTWVKNVGFTPYSWMRSTEHVLFCRKGSLTLERLGLRLDFNAKVREHSRKPDEFYDLVKEVSPGPRIDVFSRELREGFDQWGNEVDKFQEVA
jgi:N6-adenosine-specific RNA methylase IME4